MDALRARAPLSTRSSASSGAASPTRYVEMVKARARERGGPRGARVGHRDPAIALKTFLRLLAPFLPYITRGGLVVGLRAAEGAPTIHRAPWPGAADFANVPAVDGGAEVFAAAVGFLEAVQPRQERGGGDAWAVTWPVSGGRESPHRRAARARRRTTSLAAARVSRHRLRPARGHGGRSLRGGGGRARIEPRRRLEPSEPLSVRGARARSPRRGRRSGRPHDGRHRSRSRAGAGSPARQAGPRRLRPRGGRAWSFAAVDAGLSLEPEARGRRVSFARTTLGIVTGPARARCSRRSGWP